MCKAATQRHFVLMPSCGRACSVHILALVSLPACFFLRQKPPPLSGVLTRFLLAKKRTVKRFSAILCNFMAFCVQWDMTLTMREAMAKAENLIDQVCSGDPACPHKNQCNGQKFLLTLMPRIDTCGPLSSDGDWGWPVSLPSHTTDSFHLGPKRTPVLVR